MTRPMYLLSILIIPPISIYTTWKKLKFTDLSMKKWQLIFAERNDSEFFFLRSLNKWNHPPPFLIQFNLRDKVTLKYKIMVPLIEMFLYLAFQLSSVHYKYCFFSWLKTAHTAKIAGKLSFLPSRGILLIIF